MADKSQNKICFHCGTECGSNPVSFDNKHFCCSGCKTVYEILNENRLCGYYSIESSPGIKNERPVKKEKYAFLEDTGILKKLISFSDGNIKIITLKIPVIHCSSCIWLLENLDKINPAIISGKVNFPKKEITLKFDSSQITLRIICELLDSIGYEPLLNLESIESKSENKNYKIWFELGVAGFCFGNIMLLSFPEYLNFNETDFENYKNYFYLFNLILSLPVVFYSAGEYYISAYKGLKAKFINIDVPISLGIFAIFFRSIYEVLTQTGAGYFDSLSGLVFFLLLGKLLQKKTYEHLNFERNYKSFFPLSVSVKENGIETTIPVSELNPGKRILVHNNEIIPADAVLISEEAFIDYSFVTGESLLHNKKCGNILYAGGKLNGTLAECEIVKEVSQSYLTELWNDASFKKDEENHILQNISNIFSKYFTAIVLLISFISTGYWLVYNPSLAMNAFTAILIVACPCALAISIPFTFSNLIKIFSRNGFYVKSVDVIENMTKINHIIFDKTGTLTSTLNSEIIFIGDELSDKEKLYVRSASQNSMHPVSKKISSYFNFKSEQSKQIHRFEEIPGKGIICEIDNHEIIIGSKEFTNANGEFNPGEFNLYPQTFLKIDNKIRGIFILKTSYRNNLKKTIQKLSDKFLLSMISGDSDYEKNNLLKINSNWQMLFNQSPFNKMNYVKEQQQTGKVMMIGDGLNDAGALAAANVGIAVTEDVNNFSPACDAILEAGSFEKLTTFMNVAKTGIRLVLTSYIISFLYNIVGLYFAVQGTLSPLIAAILMPLSSITIVVFSTLSVNYFAKKSDLL